MVHNSGSTTLFQVKLVGFEGVADYDTSLDATLLEQVMALAALMTGGKKRVPDAYWRRKEGELFGSKDLRDAEYFYRLIAGEKYLEEFTYGTLSDLWHALGPQMVTLAEGLKDDAMVEELREILAVEVVGHEKIAGAVAMDRMNTGGG